MMKKFTKLLLSLMLVLTLAGITNVSAKTKLNYTKKTLYAGKSFTLKVKGTKKKAVFTASNSKVTLSSKKKRSVKVKGVTKGKCTITARVGKKKYKCKVTVKVKKGSINVTNNVTLDVNDSTTLNYTTNTTGVINAAVSDPNIVSATAINYNKTVSISGLKEGSAVVTLTNTYTNAKAKINVTVSSPAKRSSLTLITNLPSEFAHGSIYGNETTIYSRARVNELSVKIENAFVDDLKVTISGTMTNTYNNPETYGNSMDVKYNIRDTNGNIVKNGDLFQSDPTVGSTYTIDETVFLSEGNYTIELTDSIS